MAFATEVFPPADYPRRAAERIAAAIPASGSVALTGGTTVEPVYEALAELAPPLASIDILFSDERCEPPADDASNYKMAARLLLGPLGADRVHRMKGEDPPDRAAHDYHNEIEPIVAQGIDLLLLGMGADAHIGALYPASAALNEQLYCAAVDRPDRMKGLTLTPPAMLAAKKVLLLVTGAKKAETVARVINSAESTQALPARLLADHPDATFLLDEEAATAL